MRDRRFLLNCVLICLPAAALFVVGLYFMIVEAPRLQAKERARMTREYRRTAEELARGPTPESREGKRRAGWRQVGKLSSGERTLAWGHAPLGEARAVWVEEGASVRFATVPVAGYPDLGLYLTVFAGLILLLFAGITFFCLRFFLQTVRERDDFLAATAHDLTTPLVGMRYLIGRSDDDARQLNERLLRLVTNIKDFLKLGGRRVAPQISLFPAGRAFAEAYRIFAADYEDERSGPVRVEGDPALPVAADETLVVQILWNLLGNELKYAAPYGRVTVSFRREGTAVLVDFIDEGPGMTRRQRRKAFDRYYRAQTALVSGKGGFGIGLCTAREFARRMGGDLTVAAGVPKGCVFTLRLRAGLPAEAGH